MGAWWSTTLREGERSLSQLWLDYHVSRLRRTGEGQALSASELLERVRRDYPVPALLDFRMSSKGYVLVDRSSLGVEVDRDQVRSC